MRLGIYLGVPIIVLCECGDGWLCAIYPDKDQPGKRPYAYRQHNIYRFWRDQVKITHELPSR